MKLDQIKAAIAEASAKSSEALGEVGKRIADLEQQVKDLIEANSNPDVTDETFLANLEKLRTDVSALAEIVPAPPAPPVEPEPPAPAPVEG